jgi:hypothetical protein
MCALRRFDDAGQLADGSMGAVPISAMLGVVPGAEHPPLQLAQAPHEVERAPLLQVTVGHGRSPRSNNSNRSSFDWSVATYSAG